MPITEGGGDFYPPRNITITNILALVVMEQSFSHDTFVARLVATIFDLPPPGDPVVTMFGPYAPFWVLLNKSTQADSIQISLVQVDLE